MGQVVLLVPTDAVDVPIGSRSIEAFVRICVTKVSLAADNRTTAIVLEGWAFDGVRSGAAMRALAGSHEETRTLQLIVQMTASAAASQGGIFP